MPVCSNFLKPVSSALTRYAPSCSNGARYNPLSFVMTTRISPVSVFVTVTVTPGSTAPDSSVTVPSSVALMAWPWAKADEARASKKRKARLTRNIGGNLRKCDQTAVYLADLQLRRAGQAVSAEKLRRRNSKLPTAQLPNERTNFRTSL